MNSVMADLSHAWPEVYILTMACVLLVVDLYLTERFRFVSYLLAQVTLLGAAMLTLGQMGGEGTAFTGAFVHDAMSDILKLFIYLVSAMVFLYARDYLKARNLLKGEFYMLGLFGVLGMMLLASAHSLLMLYLGLELMSLSMYALVAFNRDSPVASEAAMKYFVLGAIASGMLLYGMSLIYGATGSLDVATVAQAVTDEGVKGQVIRFGVVFLLVGLAFKLGAAPFHMWLPDVYQGAPTAVTLYLSAAPKIAAFAMFIRLLVDGLSGLVADWQQMLAVMAVLSLAIGNVVAIAQTNIKRMLAYSTISHAGFLLLGVLAGTPDGYAAAMFYTLTYAIMAAAGFGMITVLSRAGFEAEEIDDFKGLNSRSPWMAGMMAIIMFSMAGVPPTVGFFAKLGVLEAVLAVDMVWLALAAVFFSIIGAYYYIRVVKVMYFDEAADESPLEAAVDTRIVVSANALAVLYLGLFPGTLMAICNAALGA